MGLQGADPDAGVLPIRTTRLVTVTQNIYDNPAFFEGYAQLPRSVHGLDGAPEWPALRALVPDLQGLRVLDLGCGFGWFCRWARTRGAQSALGLDVSEKMLGQARALTSDAVVSYVRADLESLELQEGAFDFAYSSLAFHYIKDLPGLLKKVHRALVPGASLLFSIEHPIFVAPRRPGWITDEQGRKSWPVDSYQMEGPRTTNWLADGVVKQHRTMGTLLNMLLVAGFSISHVEEWGPTDAQVMAQPDLAEEKERPMMLLVGARR
ncbi:Trans-aconitate 2-methyltransferase [compost metagenome]